MQVNNTFFGRFGGVIGDLSEVLTLRMPTNAERSNFHWVDIDLATIRKVAVIPTNAQTAILQLQLQEGNSCLFDMEPINDADVVLIEVRPEVAERIGEDLLGPPHPPARITKCGPTLYEVDRIVGWRVRGGRAEFETKWVGCTDAQNTWEPSGNLTGYSSVCRAHFWEFVKGIDDDRLWQLLPKP